MKKYYFSVTYEVCEHNNIYLDMNEYNLDLDKQIRECLGSRVKAEHYPKNILGR